MSAPVIGLTLDAEDAGGYSKFPWYAIRKNYCAAVRGAGGLPVVLPHETFAVAEYIDLIDGLIVTGGAFDVDPRLFGARPSPKPPWPMTCRYSASAAASSS
jgi:putative glutamine amidotransferase